MRAHQYLLQRARVKENIEGQPRTRHQGATEERVMAVTVTALTVATTAAAATEVISLAISLSFVSLVPHGTLRSPCQLELYAM